MVAGNQTSLEEPFPPIIIIGHKSNRIVITPENLYFLMVKRTQIIKKMGIQLLAMYLMPLKVHYGVEFEISCQSNLPLYISPWILIAGQIFILLMSTKLGKNRFQKNYGDFTMIDYISEHIEMVLHDFLMK